MRNDAKILAALLTARSVPEAAKVAKVSERTIYNRLADDSFRAAYVQQRREALNMACKCLQSALVDAVEVLSSTMRDTEAAPQHRITAARSVLDYGVKLTELTDLAARVEALEACQYNSK